MAPGLAPTEELAAGEAAVSAIDPARRFEQRYIDAGRHLARAAGGQVEDRLGSEPWHGGAPDMLEVQSAEPRGRDGGGESGGFGAKERRPAGIVRHEPYCLGLQAERLRHASLRRTGNA